MSSPGGTGDGFSCPQGMPNEKGRREPALKLCFCETGGYWQDEILLNAAVTPFSE